MLLASLLLSLQASDVPSLPTVLARPGDTLPSGDVISTVVEVASNARGGSAISVRTTDGNAVVVGSSDGSPPIELYRVSPPVPASPVATLVSALELGTGSDHAFGVAWGNNPGPCMTGYIERSGQNLFCITPGAGPIPGSQFLGTTKIAISDTGEGVYVLSTLLTNGNFSDAIYSEANPGVSGPTPLLITRQTIPGLSGGVDRIAGTTVSASGAHFGAAVSFLNGNSDAIVLDGAPLTVDGQVVRQGGPLDPLTPGGEVWSALFSAATCDTGDWWVQGRVGQVANTGVVLVKNGQVVLRVGDVVDGLEVLAMRGIEEVTEDGRLAIRVITRTNNGIANDALWVDGRLVLYRLMPLDADGDGQVDPGWRLISVIGRTDIDPDGMLRAVCRVTDGATQFVTLVGVGLPQGEVICAGVPNSAGPGGTVEAIGRRLITGPGIEVTASGLPPGQLALWITSRTSANLPGAGGSTGTLCIGGNVGRYNGSIGPIDVAGDAALHVDFASIPQPNGFVSAVPGEVWNFQLWHRDVTSGGQPTSNFSAAIALEAR